MARSSMESNLTESAVAKASLAESVRIAPPFGSAPSRVAPPSLAGVNTAALAALVHQHAINNGSTPTAIPFLSLLRSTQSTPFTPGMLKPSVCLVVQGAKKILIGKDVISYGAGNFLAASVDMPTSGHVVVASRTKPYLSVRLELKPSEVASIALDAKLELSGTVTPGAYVGTADADLHDAVMRLMRLLGKPHDIPFLARSIKQEIIYRLLTSPDGQLLYHNIVADNHGVGIGKALRWIKSNYAQPLHIEQLARDVNLSVSGFHHKFKAVTTIPPLQYQKRIRLLEARRILLADSVDAATAAFKVGYESASQFSREYRRLFGTPPLQDVENLRKSALGAAEQD